MPSCAPSSIISNDGRPGCDTAAPRSFERELEAHLAIHGFAGRFGQHEDALCLDAAIAEQRILNGPRTLARERCQRLIAHAGLSGQRALKLADRPGQSLWRRVLDLRAAQSL